MDSLYCKNAALITFYKPEPILIDILIQLYAAGINIVTGFSKVSVSYQNVISRLLYKSLMPLLKIACIFCKLKAMTVFMNIITKYVNVNIQKVRV